jgi:hypothetical protein
MFRASHYFRCFSNFSNDQTGDTVMWQQNCNVFIFPLVSFARPQQPIARMAIVITHFSVSSVPCCSRACRDPGPRQIEVKEILIFWFFKIHFVDCLLVNRFFVFNVFFCAVSHPIRL